MKEKLIWGCNQLKEYGIRVALSTALNKVYFYGTHTDELAYKINKWKHRCIINCLEKKYSNLIECYKEILYEGEQESLYKDYIWTIWWQGEENAPEALKMCYNSMRQNASGHKVVVISESNLNTYIELPEYILKKVEEEKISLIHLADIIRMNLLSKYGGMWLDATIFLTDSIPEEIWQYTYYTGKLKKTKMACVSEGRWNGTFFAGKAGNPFFSFMVEFYNQYWEKHNQVIDYFLIDYMTEIAYTRFGWFRDLLDAVPFNNPDIFKLGPMLNETFNEQIYSEVCKGTVFHKLQRRNSYIEIDENGVQTLYGYLRDKYRRK